MWQGGLMLEIRKLDYINVRGIWKDEARDFTQWLAQNIDYLNDKLGFNINVLETERQVGSFNVDIFGEDEQGNSVIIENQLEKTDHAHLGQLLTYAVGVDAKTIIWISPMPREEHIEVIEWLNEITPVDIRWYLFKLEVIKIKDSPVSPLFTKVIGPSQEIKILGKEKKETAERHLKRLEFWENLLPVINNKTNLYKNINPSKDNWLNASSGVGGVYYSIVVRMENTSVLLVIEKTGNRDFNKKIFDFLYSNKEKIEELFSNQLIWRRMDEQISSRIQYDIGSCGLSDKPSWTEGYEKIARILVDFEKAFHSYIVQIKNL
jgi:hypothetical protein